MGTNTNSLQTGQNLTPPQSQFVDPATGELAQDGYQYFLGLINQLSNAWPIASIATGLKAAGSTQATALALTEQWNEVDVASGGQNSVLLAPLQPGQSQTVFNNSGMTIDVFPPVGLQIDALGENAEFSLANGSRLTFDFTSTTQIRS